jgi:UPF0755 protein
MVITKKLFTFRLFILIVFCIGYIWWLTSKDMMITQTQIYHVQKGATIDSISEELSNHKLIKSKIMFNLIGELFNYDKKLKLGYYEIEPEMSVLDFFEVVTNGRVATVNITFIEGKTINEYFQMLNSNPAIHSNLSLQETMNLIAIKEPYEGRFFPETFNFDYGESASNVLKRSNIMMQEKLDILWHNRAKTLPYKSPYEAIILASLIEKETSLDDEKHLISGVFIRRLEKGMRLQTDPSVIYALGEDYEHPLKKSDLNIDSLYNTYRYNGLPPGAISSVSYSSLYAAFHPDNGTTLYFVSKKDGSHAFASNYDEHRDNIKKFLSGT